MVGLIHFSTEPDANKFGAAPIDWREGQPARSVNNSSREEMAALARWLNDNSGRLLAAGTATGALTLATAQGVTEADVKTGLTLAFRVNANNPGPSTLKPDAAPAKALRRPGNIALAPGDLSANRVYQTVYSEDVVAHIIVAPAIEPPGTIAAFGAATAIPPGWLSCDGAAVSRSTYAALFDAIGTTHGAGNGTTTFNLPDLRGRTLFGADGGTGRLTAAGGLEGDIGDVGGSATTSLTLAQIPAHDHGGATGQDGDHDHGGATGNGGAHDHGGDTGLDGDHNHTGTTATEPAHDHTGSTTGGGHSHNGSTASGKNGVAAAGSGISTLWYGADTADPTSTTAPSHGLNINAGGAHNHPFTTSTAPKHKHTIANQAAHAHGITAAPKHAHSIALAGSGQAHANMPPGLVAVWAIKA